MVLAIFSPGIVTISGPTNRYFATSVATKVTSRTTAGHGGQKTLPSRLCSTVARQVFPETENTSPGAMHLVYRAKTVVLLHSSLQTGVDALSLDL